MSIRLLTTEDNVACQAFALCTRPAVGAVRHPILIAYLSCQECADKLEVKIESVEITKE
jgi:hypothetical protein